MWWRGSECDARRKLLSKKKLGSEVGTRYNSLGNTWWEWQSRIAPEVRAQKPRLRGKAWGVDPGKGVELRGHKFHAPPQLSGLRGQLELPGAGAHNGERPSLLVVHAQAVAGDADVQLQNVPDKKSRGVKKGEPCLASIL